MLVVGLVNIITMFQNAILFADNEHDNSGIALDCEKNRQVHAFLWSVVA
jgi:hypothetical protein